MGLRSCLLQLTAPTCSHAYTPPISLLPGAVLQHTDSSSIPQSCTYSDVLDLVQLFAYIDSCVVMQFFTYIDRSNLAFAAFQFKADIHLSNSVYGLGASIFFVGYTVSQVRHKSLIYCMHSEGTAPFLLKDSVVDILSSSTVTGLGCMHLQLRMQHLSPAPHQGSQRSQTCLMHNAAMILLQPSRL